tara:strand:+ start:268 stop:498 length:231 start_codon:yes stop_codon:yes gene_type:complete
VKVDDLKVGDLIKCQHANERTYSVGIIVKITRPTQIEEAAAETATWAKIHWHEGNRTWEEMEVSLETCFEVINESR